MKNSLEFPDFIEVDSDSPEVTLDPLSKFLESATLAGTISGPHAHRLVHNFQVEAEERTKPIAAAYRKIAAAAAPKVKAPAETNALKKNFSVDAKAGYRQFFRERLEKGQTAKQILDGWLAEFPHHNPDVGALMAAVAQEFS